MSTPVFDACNHFTNLAAKVAHLEDTGQQQCWSDLVARLNSGRTYMVIRQVIDDAEAIVWEAYDPHAHNSDAVKRKAIVKVMNYLASCHVEDRAASGEPRIDMTWKG